MQVTGQKIQFIEAVTIVFAIKQAIMSYNSKKQLKIKQYTKSKTTRMKVICAKKAINATKISQLLFQ